MKPKILVSLFFLAIALNACADKRTSSLDTMKIPVIRVHPALVRIKAALSSIPDTAAATIFSLIEARPEAFLELVTSAREQSLAAGDYLQLVDKQHNLAADYSPHDLVSLEAYRFDLARKPLYLRQVLISDLQTMVAAARAEGLTLLISSTYRSFDYQAEVYTRHVRNMGQAEADLVSARPGHSQHQLGTAIDFGSITDAFAETAAGRWLAEHAWKYGFSLSYPKDSRDITGYNWESWHYRYIGRAASRLEQEYFMGMQQYLLQFWSAYFTDNLEP